MGVERPQHLFDTEAGSGRISQDARGKCTEPTLVFGPGTRFRGRRADKRANAAPRLEHAGAFEIHIDSGDGIGVDLEIDGELPNRGQLIAHSKASRSNRCPEAPFDLGVNRGGIAGIDGDDRHGRNNTNVLVQ